MKWLNKAWSDIRKGENIELYVTVIFAIGLTCATIMGIDIAPWISAVTMAVLALLAISMLGNRRRLDDLLDKQSLSPENVLLDEFPPGISARIDRAQEVWLSGINLNRTIFNLFPQLEGLLNRGGKLCVLLIDPNGTSADVVCQGMYQGLSVEKNRDMIRNTIESLERLSVRSAKDVEIRVIDFVLPFGALVIDPKGAHGAIYVKHYAYKVPNDQRPKTVIFPHNEHWWDFYILQIETMHRSGKPVSPVAPMPEKVQ